VALTAVAQPLNGRGSIYTGSYDIVAFTLGQHWIDLLIITSLQTKSDLF